MSKSKSRQSVTVSNMTSKIIEKSDLSEEIRGKYVIATVLRENGLEEEYEPVKVPPMINAINKMPIIITRT